MGAMGATFTIFRTKGARRHFTPQKLHELRLENFGDQSIPDEYRGGVEDAAVTEEDASIANQQDLAVL